MIGSAVVAACPKSIELIPVRRSDADLLEQGAFEKAILRHRPDVVLHLAWCSSGNPGYRHAAENQRWAEVTLDGAAACRRTGARLIATGTVLDDPAKPGREDVYSWSKQELRSALEEAIRHDDICWLRPHYVIDPDSHRPRLIADCLRAAADDAAVILQQPWARHDFVHVADVATAIVRVVDAQLAGIVDIGTGMLRSVKDVADACGARWTGPTEEGSITEMHSDERAETSALLGAGWRPTRTDEFFGGNK